MMNNLLLIMLVVLSGGLLCAATVNITLRRLSRVRLDEVLHRRNRGHLFDRLVKVQSELALSMAIVRTGCALAIVLVLVRVCEHYTERNELAPYVIAFFAALFLVMVFGVAVPAAWSKYAGEAFLAAALPLLMLLLGAFRPVLVVLGLIDSLVRRLAGVALEDADESTRHERELLEAVSEGEKLGAVDEEEKEMIESVIDLRDSDVEQIMTPRTEIASVEKTATLREIKNLIREVGHSRIPVYEETIDKVVGIVYAKDLLHVDDAEPFDVSDHLRPAPFVPESKNLRDLLHEFQTRKVHMAIVLDEYGGTAGLVTIEDILEELVGEIVDEYDVDEPEPFVRIDEHTVELDARMRVEEINEELDIALPEDEDYETIGGFVFSALGRVPEVGDTCVHDLIRLEVIDAEPRRINRLRLHITQPTESTSA